MSHNQRPDKSSTERSEREPPRSRRVWIKTRELEGMPSIDKNPPEGTYRHWRFMHWALEVGPWTVEVALQGKKSSAMAISIRHHSQCTQDWDQEVDRICVGKSTMSDKKIFDVRKSETCDIVFRRILTKSKVTMFLVDLDSTHCPR